MKSLLLSLLLPLQTLAAPSAAHPDGRPAGMPDLPPDAPSSAYRELLQRPAATKSLAWWGDDDVEQDSLDTILGVGERNLKWLEHINSKRGDKLSFTSKETQKAYPIDEPNEYNPAIIDGDYTKLKKEYPAALAAVVFENKAFTDQPPLPVADYLEWSRKLDRVYQSAARWRTMQGYLPFLGGRRKQDIRGYHFLSRLPDREAKFAGYAALPAAEKARIREWLIGLCYNGSTATVDSCTRETDNAINGRGNLSALYRKWEPKGREIYAGFFTIPAGAPRNGFRWENAGSDGSRLVAPFTDPEKEDVRRFLQDNIEDEWRFGKWDLKLPFTTANGAPYVVFEPGATPNVNRLGGERVTMNASQPLTEYDAQWTIRHEFGHVLGLPDCYVEFYAPERKVIVNYQIDTDNIMCSRRGHVKKENVDELRRAYGQN